jgi:ABC-2 type transport system ATP-binding protein
MNSMSDPSHPLIQARGLAKRYGSISALAGIDFDVYPGKIVGLIGRNGAGKTTALKAILGLTSYDGSLRVLGLDPFRERDQLMKDVCYIADVAVLPKWLSVMHAIDLVEACHPNFSREAALSALEHTDIRLESKIKSLSKGMIVQLHLALVMAIDARLLVLDEPTLGLDIMYRHMFYTALLNEYFDHSRTIIVTTHQVTEIEHILTDVMFVERGRLILVEAMSALEERYKEVLVNREHVAAARKLGALNERQALGQTLLLFEGRSRAELAPLGDVRTPKLADLFVAKVEEATQ